MTNLKRPLQVYWYLFKTFSLIGFVSFGGYMALVAMVHDKLVKEDGAISEDRITEGITLGSLLPGPLAVNIVAYVSYSLAGFPGALISILGVLWPSYLLVLTISIVYINYNTVVSMQPVLQGVVPVIIALIFQMAVGMAKVNCKELKEAGIAAFSFFILLYLKSFIAIFLILGISALCGLLWFKDIDEIQNNRETTRATHSWIVYFVFILIAIVALIFGYLDNLNAEIFSRFAEASLTLFGGGYVMVPVLKTMLIDQLNWVSVEEFLFGISLGQVTPGPILISSVFFGYKINGIVGSVSACLGIFLPSSMLMILASRYFQQLSENKYVLAGLRGVKPAIVGLIFYSGISLMFANEIFARLEIMILWVGAAYFLLHLFKIKPLIAIFSGALIGLLIHMFGF